MGAHRVCLSFDFDAWSGMIARGLTTPTPISRGEYGVMAVERILRLLAQHGAKATWFVPGTVVATYPDVIRGIARHGHEIGHHGWTHVPPANLTPHEEEEGLRRAIDVIVETVGLAPRGYRSPSWDLSPVTVDLLLSHGFVYDSSMMGDDHSPYFARRGDTVTEDGRLLFGETTKLVEMPVSWSLDDFPHFEFLRTPQSVLPGLMNAHTVEQNWVDDFEYMVETTRSGVLTYTFHPFVIGRGHRMRLLDRLIGRLAKAGARFCTMEDVASDFLSGISFGQAKTDGTAPGS